jgi:TonB family protein
MSVSAISAAQRESEAKTLRGFLAWGLAGSCVFHASLLTLASNLPWNNVVELDVEEPIEFTLVEPEAELVAAKPPVAPKELPKEPVPEPTPEPVVQKDIPEPTPEPVIQKDIPEPTPEPIVPEPTPEPIVQKEIPEPTPEPAPLPEPIKVPQPSPPPVVEKIITAAPPRPAPALQPKSQPPQPSVPEAGGSSSDFSGRSTLGNLATLTGDGEGQVATGGVGSGSSGQGTGTGSGTGSGSGSGQAVATGPIRPPVQPRPPRPQKVQKPKCRRNCNLNEDWGIEGIVRFMFDIDAKGNVVNVRLSQSSGNAELDQKAEEALKRAKFNASEKGYTGQRIKVTSETDGSGFQQQNQERRQIEEAKRRESERLAAEQERQEQEAERAELERQQKEAERAALEERQLKESQPPQPVQTIAPSTMPPATPAAPNPAASPAVPDTGNAAPTLTEISPNP